MTRYLGAHTVANGGISMAALRAGGAGMKALQIFTAPPQYYGDKATMKPDRVQRFRAALATVGIAPGGRLERSGSHSAFRWYQLESDARSAHRATARYLGHLGRRSVRRWGRNHPALRWAGLERVAVRFPAACQCMGRLAQ